MTPRFPLFVCPVAGKDVSRDGSSVKWLICHNIGAEAGIVRAWDQSSSCSPPPWARISRLPAWFAAPTMPSSSMRSISDAARL